MAYVFISHDLGMVRHISDRIAVMYLGRVVELGPWEPVSDRPLHPYTMALQQAVPIADPAVEATREVETLVGEVPDPANPPPGCPFHPRCVLAEDVCREARPELVEANGGARGRLPRRRPAHRDLPVSVTVTSLLSQVSPFLRGDASTLRVDCPSWVTHTAI